MALFTSKKNIVSIQDFLVNYMGADATRKFKLTHLEMKEYLRSKNKRCPKSAFVAGVEQEDLLRGNIILVRDVTGQVLAYQNPRTELEYLQYELTTKMDKQQLEEIRKRILLEQGYVINEEGDIVPIEEREGKHDKHKGRCKIK